MKAIINPSNATINSVKWSSADPNVASIDPNSGQLTAKNAGSTTITVTVNGIKSAPISVTVTADYTYQIVDSDDLDPMFSIKVFEGSKDITAQVEGIFGSSTTDLLGTYEASEKAIRVPKSAKSKIYQIYYNGAFHKVTEKK